MSGTMEPGIEISGFPAQGGGDVGITFQGFPLATPHSEAAQARIQNWAMSHLGTRAGSIWLP